jgi:hypothetical protein
MVDLLIPDKPEMYILIAAGVIGLIGLMLWLWAVRWARPLLTIMLAAAGAYAGFEAPALWHWDLSRITTVIAGVALGLLLGSVCFRPAQALLLALFISVLPAGALAYHDGAFHASIHGLNPATQEARVNPENTQTAPTSQPAQVSEIQNIDHYIHSQMQGLTTAQRSQILAVGLGIFLVVLLLGLLFVEVSSLVGGAWLGSLLVLWSTGVFLKSLHPSTLDWALQNHVELWALPVMGILGMAVQSHLVIQKQHKNKDKKKKKADNKSENKS